MVGQTFVNPRPNLLKQLALSGPVTSGRDENGFLPTPASKRDKRKNDGEERSKKKTRLSDKGVCFPPQRASSFPSLFFLADSAGWCIAL